MSEIIIHEVRYLNDLHKHAVAKITYEPVNGSEPFSYFVLLDEDDTAPVHQYIRSKIDSGSVEVKPCYEVTSDVRANSIRDKRNSFLIETDKYMTLDYPILDEDRELVKLYRQALRDIPQQEGFPDHIVWPGKPSFIK